jgi:hypothetical protein
MRFATDESLGGWVEDLKSVGQTVLRQVQPLATKVLQVGVAAGKIKIPLGPEIKSLGEAKALLTGLNYQVANATKFAQQMDTKGKPQAAQLQIEVIAAAKRTAVMAKNALNLASKAIGIGTTLQNNMLQGKVSLSATGAFFEEKNNRADPNLKEAIAQARNVIALRGRLQQALQGPGAVQTFVQGAPGVIYQTAKETGTRFSEAAQEVGKGAMATMEYSKWLIPAVVAGAAIYLILPALGHMQGARKMWDEAKRKIS